VIEIIKERSIPASAQRVWEVVSDVHGLPGWFARAQQVELLSGEGLGRRQRVSSQWHGRPSEVDQVVTVFEAERELEWRHEAERLDGQPAPRFASETVVSIRLSPEGAEATRVTLASRQQPVDAEKEAMMRGNSAQLAQALETSLERLEAVVKAG